MIEECQRLLSRLESDLLRQIAIAKMEGFGNKEIAERRGLALRSVERKLGLIRRIWAEELHIR
jgi:DNA-directed RNA polymerase specialized sigma24 family protein